MPKRSIWSCNQLKVDGIAPFQTLGPSHEVIVRKNDLGFQPWATTNDSRDIPRCANRRQLLGIADLPLIAAVEKSVSHRRDDKLLLIAFRLLARAAR